MKKLNYPLILCLAFVTSIHSQFAGGRGIESDPYRIGTVEQLDSMRHFMDKHFEIIRDLDFSGTRFDSAKSQDNKGWMPVGDEKCKFSGTLDGKGKKVKNLYINRTGQKRIGLFGYIAEGHIRNLTIENCSVKGRNVVGSLAGASESEIENCRISGKVSGVAVVGGLAGYSKGNVSQCRINCSVSGERITGGMIGINEKSIKNCRSSGEVIGREATGGLVGVNGFKHNHNYNPDEKPDVNEWETFILNSSSESSVSGLAPENRDTYGGKRWTGGLVGHNQNGVIFECDASGKVVGVNEVGGLVGYNDEGRINKCYASGAVKGKKYVGGLLGENYGLTENSYASGRVSAEKTAGGLLGYNDDGWVKYCLSFGYVDSCPGSGGLVGWSQHKFGGTGVVNSSFWDIKTSRAFKSNGGEGMVTSQLKSMNPYKEAGWDFEHIWTLSDNSRYPELRILSDGNNLLKRNVVNVISGEWMREIKASSIYRNDSGYFPQNALDQDLNTAWVEGRKGYGSGEWISFEFKGPFDIEELRIVNGYTKSEKLYYANNRVKRMRLKLVTEHDELEDEINLSDIPYEEMMEKCGEVIFKTDYGKRILVNKVVFIIEEVYRGSRYDDTCISEILFIRSRYN